MGVLEDLQASVADLAAQLADTKARLARVENVEGVAYKDAARILGCTTRALVNWLNPAHPKFDQALADCTYYAGQRRFFHPHRLEAYRSSAEPKRGRGGRSDGRLANLRQGRLGDRQGAAEPPGDRAA